MPPPPATSYRGLIIGLCAAGAVLVVAAIAVVVVLIRFEDTTVATDLRSGDCIADVPTDSRVLTLPKVNCAQPHGGQVYAVFAMPDGGYPDQATIDEFQAKCPAEMNRIAPGDAATGVYVLYPTRETWAHGDRAVTCVATSNPKRAGRLPGT